MDKAQPPAGQDRTEFLTMHTKHRHKERDQRLLCSFVRYLRAPGQNVERKGTFDFPDAHFLLVRGASPRLGPRNRELFAAPPGKPGFEETFQRKSTNGA